MRKALYQIVTEAESKKTAKEQAAVLLLNVSGPLKDIIGYAMDPNVHFLLPPGEPPPYVPFKDGENMEQRLYSETRLFKYLTDGADGVNTKQNKRESVYMNLLSTVHPEDAKLVIRVVNKALKIKPEAARLAFPGITAHWK